MNKKVLTMVCCAAVALFAGSAFADGAIDSTFAELQALKDGKGNRTGRTEVFRAGVICEQDYVSGVTLALASNIDNEAHAFEFAFLVNATELNSSGFQWGWLWGNYVNYGSFTGVQWGLVQNRVGGDMTGWQAAFGMNLVQDDMTGLQTATLYNCVEEGDLAGLQLGFVNQADGDVCGAQFGLINLIGKELTGVQFGGVNIAGTAKGLQIGLFNQANDLYGIQLGFVNRLKNYDKWPYTVFVRAVF